MLRCVSFLAVLGCASGHGGLVTPPSRNAVDRFLPPFRHGQSPQTPCTCPNSGKRDHNGDHGSLPCTQGRRANAGGQPCLWWSQGCVIGCRTCSNETSGDGAKLHQACGSAVQPTLPQALWTMSVGLMPGEPDVYKYNPWRAPGAAPVRRRAADVLLLVLVQRCCWWW